jgi:adenosylcobyric acid synthase
VISVIKLPKISNFSDFDPLLMENVTIKFVTEPEELDGTGAVVIPGTKNTISDLIWMKERGITDAILKLKGKVPILGICGGYQMMGRFLEDPLGTEGPSPGTFDGLGFFDNVTRWNEQKKRTVLNDGILIKTGEPVEGYETHVGITEVKEEPLFRIERFTGPEMEGSIRESELLFGTYFHGAFEKPAFRRYFLSFVKGGKDIISLTEPRDYDDLIEENIEKLADAFESNMDIKKLMEIIGGDQ